MDVFAIKKGDAKKLNIDNFESMTKKRFPYYSLGKWIVEMQQMGQKRAKYGSKVIATLSKQLQNEFGKGFSEDTLKNARKFLFDL